MNTNTAQDLERDLTHFYGTDGYCRWSILFPDMVLTDGAKFLAERAGAYWLMDAIASHQKSARRRNEAMQDFQVWTLTVDESRRAILAGSHDSGGGHKGAPTIRQVIEYTDFPLAEQKLYVAPLGDGRHSVIMLPSEY
jgi:hypothetical protein